MRIARTRHASGTRIVRLMLITLAAVASGVSHIAAPPVAAATATTGGTSPTVSAESAASVTFRVFATREGLVGSTTASGHRITANDHFVALPSTKALNKNIRLTYKGKSAVAPVLDVGPWNVNDDYWNPGDSRYFKGIPRGVPQAQAAYESKNNGGKSGTGLNVDAPNGIDIGDGTFADLGMRDSDWVEITFLWLTDDASGSASAPQPAPAPASTSKEQAPAPKVAAVTKGSGLDLSSVPVLAGGVAPPLDRVSARGSGDTFVSQTGHNMIDVVAKYWKTKGGVQALGYPVSELFIRKIDGETHVYQYFERVLVEYLPDSGRVALAPLGSWFAEVNGPYDSVSAFSSTTKKRFVASTGHSIGGGILQWYAANGDSEVFGAPISEEYAFTTKDGRKVTAQLFERARIEIDADGDVTLGRLGAEWLAQRGWL